MPEGPARLPSWAPETLAYPGTPARAGGWGGSDTSQVPLKSMCWPCGFSSWARGSGVGEQTPRLALAAQHTTVSVDTWPRADHREPPGSDGVHMPSQDTRASPPPPAGRGALHTACASLAGVVALRPALDPAFR